MEPDKNQEKSASDAEAPTKDNAAAQKDSADTTNYGPASSGGISPVVWILLVLVVIGVASKFLTPAPTGLKANEPDAKQRGAFAPYVQGAPSQPSSP